MHFLLFFALDQAIATRRALVNDRMDVVVICVAEEVELMVEQAVTDIQKELFESSHRNEYVLERMKRISKRAVWAMEQHIKRGDFTPEEYEIAFGEENHLDSMTFALEDGEKMFFFWSG